MQPTLQQQIWKEKWSEREKLYNLGLSTHLYINQGRVFLQKVLYSITSFDHTTFEKKKTKQNFALPKTQFYIHKVQLIEVKNKPKC